MSPIIKGLDTDQPEFTMDDVNREVREQGKIEVDWTEIDALLAKVPSKTSPPWSDSEIEILKHARERGYSLRQISESGVLPGRTWRAIRSQVDRQSKLGAGED